MDRAIADLAEWKARAAAGESPPDSALRKTYIPDAIKAGKAEKRELTFVISTGAIDRDRDTLAVDGWRVEEYLKNPVVLFAHNSRGLPIAKATAVVRTAGAQLKATAEFTAPEVYGFGDMVYRMIRGGFLSATSVGFMPDEWTYNEERGGVDFKQQTLLEFSVVPVPSNPQALVEGKSAGLITPTDTKLLRGWCEQTLDELNDEPGVWLSKARVEETFKALQEPRIIVSAPIEREPEAPAKQSSRYRISKEDIREAVTQAVHARFAAELRRHTGRLD